MDYREGLRRAQSSLQAAIERQALDGQAMDVVWNLTFGRQSHLCQRPTASVDRIAAMDGVKSVVVETQYSPDVVHRRRVPSQMAVSGQMTGANAVWLEGYTGAGTRIAVIDTGLDTDHQSFDPAPLTMHWQRMPRRPTGRWKAMGFWMPVKLLRS